MVPPNKSTPSTSNGTTSKNSLDPLAIASLLFKNIDLVDSKTSKQKLYDFVCTADSSMELLNEEDKPLMLNLIKSKICGNTWYRDYEKWSDLKRHLYKVYSDKHLVFKWQKDLFSSKQLPSENVKTYSARVENCYINLIKAIDIDLPVSSRSALADYINEQARNVFIEGLKPDLHNKVKLKNPSNFGEAINWALVMDTEVNSDQKELKTGTVESQTVELIAASSNTKPHNIFELAGLKIKKQKKCTYCSKTGHTNSNCWKREADEKKSILSILTKPSSSNTNTTSTNKQKENLTKTSSDKTVTKPVEKKSKQEERPKGLPYINMPCVQSKAESISLLIKTGTNRCLIKGSKLRRGAKINKDNKYSFEGEENKKDPAHTLGTVTLTLKLGICNIKQEFHVVSDQFPLPFDGILGIDFISSYFGEWNTNSGYVDISDTTCKVHFKEVQLHEMPIFINIGNKLEKK